MGRGALLGKAGFSDYSFWKGVAFFLTINLPKKECMVAIFLRSICITKVQVDSILLPFVTGVCRAQGDGFGYHQAYSRTHLLSEAANDGGRPKGDRGNCERGKMDKGGSGSRKEPRKGSLCNVNSLPRTNLMIAWDQAF